MTQHRQEKLYLFEYFVIQLNKWKQEVRPKIDIPFSKLQLQKLLFLASTQDATIQSHPMLDMFDRFYALKYGPVELDVYEAMTHGSFEALNFGERYCEVHPERMAFIDSITEAQKTMVDRAIGMLKKRNPEYILKEPFELVEITHGWTVWQIAMMMADLSNSKMEKMSTADICNSIQKVY